MMDMGVIGLIVKFDDDIEVDLNHPKEAAEAGAVILLNHSLLTMTFNFFCKAITTADNDLDIMTFNGLATYHLPFSHRSTFITCQLFNQHAITIHLPFTIRHRSLH